MLGALVGSAHAAEAQAWRARPWLQWESRIDALAGAVPAVHGGIAANVPADYYVRVGATVAGGTGRREGVAVASARADLVARYLTDPFREFRTGSYAGAGVSARWEEGEGWRALLTVLVGFELPDRGRWRPAIELGVGGGVRLTLAVRRARENGR